MKSIFTPNCRSEIDGLIKKAKEIGLIDPEMSPDITNKIIIGNHSIIFNYEKQPQSRYKHISVALTDSNLQVAPVVLSMILKLAGYFHTDPLATPSKEFFVSEIIALNGKPAINAWERGLDHMRHDISEMDLVITV